MKHLSHSSPAPSHRSQAMFLLRATNLPAVTSLPKADLFRQVATKGSKVTNLPCLPAAGTTRLHSTGRPEPRTARRTRL